MTEAEARSVLLVRAIEEADTGAAIVEPARRVEASRRACETAGIDPESAAAVLSERAIVERAGSLEAWLVERRPALARAGRLAGPGARLTLVLATGGLVLGFGSDLVGAGRRIHILSLPLLGLLAWNAVVYVALVARAIVRARPGFGRLGESLWGEAFARRLARWRVALDTPRGEAEVLSRAAAEFAARWSVATAPLAAARLRRALHLAAAAAIGGAVSGMYLRGLALEYRATWESTWLDANAVQAFVRLALALPAALAGLEIPAVAPLRAPASGEAAPWIHLWALAALLYVGLPRLALAVAAELSARRLARRVPIDLEAPYFRRLLAPWRGAATRVVAVPYGTRLAPLAADRLAHVLQEAFGARAAIRVAPAVDYGAELDAFAGTETAGTVRAVVFGLAQTPEDEVHGALLRSLRENGDTVVLVDRSPYAQRVSDPARLAERSRAWERFVESQGLTAVVLDLADRDPVPPDLLDRLRPSAAREGRPNG